MDIETKIRLRNRVISAAPRMAEIVEDLRLARYFSTIRHSGYSLPLPGPIKRAIIKGEAVRIGATEFVETGTYLGDTLWYFRDHFSKLFSIEIDPRLASAARRRFKDRPHVRILEGDSSSMLSQLAPEIGGPALFFLDGHYSGGITGKGDLECPIWAELNCILGMNHQNYSIIIDDARLFGRDKDYPPLPALHAFLAAALPNHLIKVENDLIFVQKPLASDRVPAK